MARRPKGELQRDILDSATELFLATGDVNAVSIDEVVAKVGCTPPALYYYFPTKAALMRCVCSRIFATFMTDIETTIRRDVPDSVAQLAERGRAYLKWAIDHPAEFRLIFLDNEASTLANNDDPMTAPGLAELVNNVVRAQEAGHLTGFAPQALALTFWAVVHGHATLAVGMRLPAAELESSFLLAQQAMTRALCTSAEHG